MTTNKTVEFMKELLKENGWHQWQYLEPVGNWQKEERVITLNDDGLFIYMAEGMSISADVNDIVVPYKSSNTLTFYLPHEEVSIEL